MSARVIGVMVSFDTDMRQEDAEAIMRAIECIRHVRTVEPHVVDEVDWLAREKVRGEWAAKIWEVLQPSVTKKLEGDAAVPLAATPSTRPGRTLQDLVDAEKPAWTYDEYMERVERHAEKLGVSVEDAKRYFERELGITDPDDKPSRDPKVMCMCPIPTAGLICLHCGKWTGDAPHDAANCEVCQKAHRANQLSQRR